MRVLIVDNQPRARRSMKALLEAWYKSAELWEAADGDEAVRFANELHPDLILMDARMPKKDGLEATQIIKAQENETRVIVLSMYPDVREQALAAGADAFVSKGDPPETLHKVIEDLITEISRSKK